MNSSLHEGSTAKASFFPAFRIEQKNLPRWHAEFARICLLESINKGGITEGGVDFFGGDDFHSRRIAGELPFRTIFPWFPIGWAGKDAEGKPHSMKGVDWGSLTSSSLKVASSGEIVPWDQIRAEFGKSGERVASILKEPPIL